MFSQRSGPADLAFAVATAGRGSPRPGLMACGDDVAPRCPGTSILHLGFEWALTLFVTTPCNFSREP